MQLATMQLFACSMQLATKAITTAIKLATLQQNGRSITCKMCAGRPNSAIVLNMFIRHSGRRQIQIQIQNKARNLGQSPTRVHPGGEVKFPRHQSHVARTQMHWHTLNSLRRLRVGQH